MNRAALSGAAVFAAWLIVAVSAAAQDAYDPYENPEAPPITLRGLADLRIVQPGRDLAASDGGSGKTRYGGNGGGGAARRTTRFALSQGALELNASLPAQIGAHIQINWEADVDTYGDVGNDQFPRLVEALARRTWAAQHAGWSWQAGVLNPPFSLEQLGPAWTPRFTLTPSAANSWLWEEVRLLGSEIEAWNNWDTGWRADVYTGLGWGPDPAGLLLAQRGWVLSDFLSGINSELRVPGSAKRSAVFNERDGRPAIYGGAVLNDPCKLGELRIGYFDNLGDADVRGVWHTRFGSAGVTLQPLNGLDLLMQVMAGETTTRGSQWGSTFVAWYPLASYRWRSHRLSLRYDSFAVHDDDDGTAQSRERGDALTAAYLYEIGLRHRLGIEYITISSHRPQRFSRDVSDDQWQLSYRFRY